MNDLILAWFDNFHMVVFTPNGRRETHLMGIEFVGNAGSVISVSVVKYQGVKSLENMELNGGIHVSYSSSESVTLLFATQY